MMWQVNGRMPSPVPTFKVCLGADFGKDFIAETALQLHLEGGKVEAPGRGTAWRHSPGEHRSM